MSIFCLHKNTHLSQIHLTIDVGWCFNAVAVARAQFATQFRSFVYIHFSMGESNECMTCIYKFLFLLLHSWRFLFLLVLLWIISIVLCHFILSSCKRISHVVHLFREHFFFLHPLCEPFLQKLFLRQWFYFEILLLCQFKWSAINQFVLTENPNIYGVVNSQANFDTT